MAEHNPELCELKFAQQEKKIDKLNEMAEAQTQTNNAILLTLSEIKNDGTWLKKEVENHIKNSVTNIKQIGKNKDSVENVLVQAKFQWFVLAFLTTSTLGCCFFVIRQVVTKGI